jgi:photosystem II stability/assembly factor-like uncharacterized protein
MASKRAAIRLASIIVPLVALCTFVAPAALAVTPVTTPDGLWTWVNPLPHGFPANGGIASPTQGTLFIATTTPDLLVTRDGGASWSWSPTGSVPGFDTVSGVTFVSHSEGWAWGSDAKLSSGMLLHTADAGASWQLQLSTPGGSTLTEVRFADPKNGWAVATVTSSGVVVLYRTGDGGANWAEIAQPPAYPRTYFAALVPQSGGQAVLLRTIVSWNQMPIATFVWRTADGGASWSGPVTVAGSVLTDATFASANQGWAVSSRDPWVWGTTDGGASWTKIHRGSAGSAAITHVGSDVWVLSYAGALHSPDGGVSWHSLPGTRGSSISFSSPLDGFVAGDSGYRRTTNGGRSWTRLSGAAAFAPTGLAAGSGGIVWGVDDHLNKNGTTGYLIRSSDAGKHWQRVTQKSNLNAVAAIGSQRAWAVGPRGSIIHTADGGRHWVKQKSGVAVDLADVFFLDAKHGWISGDKGDVLRTSDGGRHWARNHTTVGRSGVVTFADVSHGVVVPRFRPFILTTANGGRSWSKTRFSAPNFQATAVTMKDASHWLLLSSGGHSWITDDAGSTWRQGADLPQSFETSMPVDMARSGSRLCAVDWNGNVATSANDGATWSLDADLRGLVSCTAFVGDHTLLLGGGAGILTRDLRTAPLR